MKNFALIGAAGYIAVKHMKAIKDTQNNLIAALDKFDSVGIIDSYFPNADFFTEFERFDRHFDKLKRSGISIDYVSICTPNYLHDSHIRFALRQQSDAICEKPLVLNPWNVDALEVIEKETGRRINNILQLRMHPSIVQLKNAIEQNPVDKKYEIDLAYITSRGKWYFQSWKSEISKSGGIASNIGIHFFDMLIWIFGNVRLSTVHLSESNKAAGFLQLDRANVRWFMSLDYNDIPPTQKAEGKRVYRNISIDGNEFEFSEGFTDLHTLSYQEILKNNGFSIDEARKSIQLVYNIRNSKAVGIKNDYHPLARQ